MIEMKIEEGKFYKTRDGRKVGMMIKSTDYVENIYYSSDKSVTGQSWYEDGTFLRGSVNNLDLVEEWGVKKTKFKVGDRVNSISGKSYDKDWQNVKIHKIDRHGIWAINNEDGREGLFDDESLLELTTPATQSKSPVVEKTVKRIKAGVYNQFLIEPHTDDAVLIGLDSPDGCIMKVFTASELESAAKTFMELAQFLKEPE